MDARVRDLINQQINKELYSAYLYMDIADYYEEEGLKGYANYYMIQAQEERDHALIFRNYLHENGEKVVLDAIAKGDRLVLACGHRQAGQGAGQLHGPAGDCP